MSIIEQTVEPLAEPFEVESDPRREVLWRAAELIEEHGHVKGDLGSTERGFCIFGAGIYAAEELVTRNYAVTALGGFAAVSALITWNNAPGRTKEEVVTRLRKLAEGPLS